MALDGNGNGRGNGPFDPKDSDLATVVAHHADHVGKTERHEKKFKTVDAQLEAIATAIGKIDGRLDTMVPAVIEQGVEIGRLSRAYETQARAADVVAFNFERLVGELTTNQAHRDWLTKSIQKLAEARGVELEPAP